MLFFCCKLSQSFPLFQLTPFWFLVSSTSPIEPFCQDCRNFIAHVFWQPEGANSLIWAKCFTAKKRSARWWQKDKACNLPQFELRPLQCVHTMKVLLWVQQWCQLWRFSWSIHPSRVTLERSLHHLEITAWLREKVRSWDSCTFKSSHSSLLCQTVQLLGSFTLKFQGQDLNVAAFFFLF